ncbi:MULTISPECIES: hypothetical protein [Enterococcus]|uniref:hypothetical protein n=1 Tax=Enterococcus TaxID=1350 RepID=UPI000352DD64|nr:hypothetical protein [Enterococcus faecalis]EGO7660003.1 hypothetical protein [Enterococcus faecalis]EGO7835290.1 hypothetical protein [Enterococcus faecalis]EGO8127275.1 hypothetical protein [Enterococcus faecalis]EGO8156309.1 hypothetical protein [Enterococcus faecalis]EGO8275645.1 hypothetical protein [Enterococcus faecalis]
MDTIDLLLITFVLVVLNFEIFIFSLYSMIKRKKLNNVDEEFRKRSDADSLLIDNIVVERSLCIWAENVLNKTLK